MKKCLFFLFLLFLIPISTAIKIDIVAKIEGINASSYSPFIDDVDKDDFYEITIASENGIYIFGQNISHVFITNASVYGLGVDDINGDGTNEIIACVNNSLMILNTELKPAGKITFDKRIRTSPALADVDHDGFKEIFISLSNGDIISLEHNLSIKWMFKPLPMPSKPRSGVRSNPLVFDVNNDGLYEVVYGTRLKRIFVLDAVTGKLLCFKRVGYDVDASPAVADLNKDGIYEIIFATGEPLTAIGDDMVYVMDGNCNTIWKYKVGGAVDSSPVIADINNDGWDEVLVTTLRDGSLYALSHDGKLLWKWPKEDRSCCEYRDRSFFCYYKFGGCRSYITPAVIYQNNQAIVIFSMDNGIYYFINGSDGKLLYEFDTGFRGANRFSPVAYDLDKDGNAEVIIANKDLYILSVENSTADWPFFRHDSLHTGNVNKLEIRKLKDRETDPLVYIKYYLYHIYLDVLEFYFCYYQKLFSFLLNDPNPFGFIC